MPTISYYQKKKKKFAGQFTRYSQKLVLLEVQES